MPLLIFRFVLDDPPSDIGEEDDELEMRGSSARETSLANLELGDGDRSGNLNSTTNDDTGTSTSKEIKPKRKIAKQPLLNADRILGKRGIRVLEKMFEDFEPRGKIDPTHLVLCFYQNVYDICYTN